MEIAALTLSGCVWGVCIDVLEIRMCVEVSVSYFSLCSHDTCVCLVYVC